MKLAKIDLFSSVKKPIVIAGPCSAESEAQVFETAKKLNESKQVNIFRAGIWKPRTRPGGFEGVGEVGLPWLKRVRQELNMPVMTEVANSKHVDKALEFGLDALWIGARTTVNPFLIQEIADSLRGVDIPVFIKNPINADLGLWIGAFERFNKVGIEKLVAIHRGFSTTGDFEYRNNPIWRIPIEFRRQFPEIPMICDPSHIAGDRMLVQGVCQKAMDIDMDGLMIEVHPSPDSAWSDAKQQVTPSILFEILNSLSIKTEFSIDSEFENELEKLRNQIDNLDDELIQVLKSRFVVVKKIGLEKIHNNITALQVHRLEQMMRMRIAKGKSNGLAEKFIKEMFDVIHEESVRIQTELKETTIS